VVRSMLSKPIIGLTGGFIEVNSLQKGIYVHHYFPELIVKNGGIPIIIPFSNLNISSEIMEVCDGIILTGGHDIDPEYYKQDPHPKIGETIALRDEMEIKLVKEAHKRNIPILGICRGMQLINIAFGGTLIQDINSQIVNPIKHLQENKFEDVTHYISIDKNSMLAELIGGEQVKVNSFHHQAIDLLAVEFTISATASDGIIEAIEYRGNTFILGVQWHPESLIEVNPQMNNLFKFFMSKSCDNMEKQ